MDMTGMQETPNGQRALAGLIEAIRRWESRGTPDETAASLWPSFREAVAAALEDGVRRDAHPILQWYGTHPTRGEPDSQG